jgi:hypothetical protein
MLNAEYGSKVQRSESTAQHATRQDQASLLYGAHRLQSEDGMLMNQFSAALSYRDRSRLTKRKWESVGPHGELRHQLNGHLAGLSDPS